MADLEMKMKLRELALNGNEWALDMLVSDAELGAVKSALDSISRQFEATMERATALNHASTLPAKPAGA